MSVLSVDALRENLYPTPDPHVTAPAEWVTYRLREELWSKQRTILESVRDNRRTAVHSCHGAGKSFIAARAAAWWLETHPPGTAFVVSTAPTWKQVRAILWREIGRAHRKGKLKGRVNQTEWWMGEELVGYGSKPADQDEEGFQGIHAMYVLVLVDEAAGIPDALWTAILALLTTADCRVLAIGNPDYEGSHFSRICAPGSGWNTVHIDGLETPNFTGEHVPIGAPLLDQSWIDDLVKDYGEDSPQYLAKVRGQFPADRTDGIIPWSWAHQSQGEAATARIDALRVPVELGVDVGGGGDLTVIRERRGARAGRRWMVNSDRAEVIANEIALRITESGATSVKLDFGGIGFAIPALVRSKLSGPAQRCELHEVNFGAGAKDKRKYVNTRAELWWEGRLRSEPDSVEPWDLTEVDDRTMADLTEPRWFETPDGRIQVEEKDEVRKRLGRSPDDGDALLLAFYQPTGKQATRSKQDRSRVLRGTR